MKIIFTTYTGYPNANIGGPNKIIHNIIHNLDLSKFITGYFSKQFNHTFVKEELTYNIEDYLNKKTSISNYLIKNNVLFRNFVTSPLYLKYHYYTNDRYFSKNLNYFYKFDLIHAHDIFSFDAIKKLPLKKILTIHSKGSITDDVKDYCNSKILSKAYSRMEKKENDALEMADLITFPSFAAKDFFLARKGISDSNKYIVLYNGIDINEINNVKDYDNILHKYNINKTYEIILLNISDHINVKNIPVLIDVVDLLVYKYKLKPLLINIGKGPETENLLNKIRKKRLTENVTFLKNVSNIDVIKLFKISDFFLMASERVIFDLVILEAMAAGSTIIATNQGGNREIISNGVNGYLIDTIKPEEYIKIILADKNKNILKNGFETIKNFDNSLIINKLSRLYFNL
jgi:glycosyltransferase involved in cell wall biosynthesis